jgi:hypothetical protein
MTLYVIGSFFPALAARDRVKILSIIGNVKGIISSLYDFFNE